MSDTTLDRLLALRQLRERRAAAAVAGQAQAAREAAERLRQAEAAYRGFRAELEAEESATLHYLATRLDMATLQKEYARRLTAEADAEMYRAAIEQARGEQAAADAQRAALARTHLRQRTRREAIERHRLHLNHRARQEAERRDEDDAERPAQDDWTRDRH
ncbi:hypothetical protein JQR85_14180 [Stutzerimonas urumqiensis]|uniref:hypothetical protein n=1 Tax=Stutzerimonas urumqiensis TaxID=638269 RepID=UPI003DA40D9F